jgi:hypothetical protein
MCQGVRQRNKLTGDVESDDDECEFQRLLDGRKDLIIKIGLGFPTINCRDFMVV